MRRKDTIALGTGALLVAMLVLWVAEREEVGERAAAPETAGTNEVGRHTEDLQLVAKIETSPGSVAAPAAAPGCTIETQYLLNADGTATTVYTCPDPEPAPEHPYIGYTTEALEELAYADGKAAEILGMRLREADEAAALSLILRASALTGGDPAPILAYSNAYPQPTAIDGVPVRKTVHAKFILSAVAEMLGAERNNLPHWENQIRQVSSDPDREIELLIQRARQLLDEMRRIELDVTGSSTFGGPSDA